MDNIKSEYLSYIRLMYERESSKGNHSGITKWGVIIGVVYIAWHFIDAFSEIARNPLAIHVTILMYGMIYLSIDSFADFFRRTASLRISSKFNLRIKGNRAWEIENNIPWLTLAFVLPLISLYRREDFIYKELGWPEMGAFIEAQAMINQYYLIALLIIITTFIAFSLYYENKKGFPTPISIIAHTRGDGTLTFWKVISIELAFGNAVASYITLMQVSQSLLKPILICSLDAVLIALALIYLSHQRSQLSRIEQILSLERDLIFHNLSEEEIKFRIQEEFIGHEFGDWLSDKVSKIRTESSKLIELANAAITQSEEINALPQTLTYERSGRISKLLDDLEGGFTSYQRIVQPLLSWLLPIANGSGAYEKHIVETINKIFLELKQINKDTEVKLKEAISILRKVNY